MRRLTKYFAQSYPGVSGGSELLAQGPKCWRPCGVRWWPQMLESKTWEGASWRRAVPWAVFMLWACFPCCLASLRKLSMKGTGCQALLSAPRGRVHPGPNARLRWHNLGFFPRPILPAPSETRHGLSGIQANRANRKGSTENWKGHLT